MTDADAGGPTPSGQRAVGQSATNGGATVRSGTRWMTGSNAGVQLARLLSHIVLARLLTPDAFGLMAMALVVMMFLEMLRDLGTRSAIVQKKEISQRFTSSIFFVNLAVGVLTTAGLAAAAPLIARLFGDPDLTPLLQVLALSSLATAFGLVQQGLLQRNLQFKGLAAVRFTNALGHGVVAIALALAGFGVWSLVVGVIAGAAASSLVAWTVSPWRPRWQFSWSDPLEVASYSLNLTGAVLVRFIMHTCERVIIARGLGSTPLGYWALVDRMFRYPWETVGQVMIQVMFPALSRLEDQRSVGTGYLRSIAVLTLVTAPAMIGFALVAEPFTRAVLGEQWLPAVPIMMILAPVSAAETLMTSTALIYQVQGRTDWQLRWSLASSAAIVGGLAAGIPWGLQGVAVAYAIVRAVLFYPAIAIPFRLVNLRFADLVRTLAPYFLATAIMSGAVVGVRMAVAAAHAGSWAVLLASVLAGGVVYVGLLAAWHARALADLLSVLPPRWRHRLRFLAPGRAG